ncbi:hypothetical protein KEM54_000385 [Ascosphaera aggregata]|nr:hypothetical protein KEM54_000385 [Ascosphaera aggregata]
MRGPTLTSRTITTFLECQLHGYLQRHASLAPASFTTCLYRRRRVLRDPQVRHFLGITNWTTKGNNNDVDKDSGVKQMTELVAAIRTKVRPPPPYILAKAYKKFVDSRLENTDILTLEQAQFLHATIEHLVKNYWNASGAVKTALQSSTLVDTLSFVASSAWERNSEETIKRFSRFVYEALCCRTAEEDGTDQDVAPDVGAIHSYISILSASNSTSEALELLEACWDGYLDQHGTRPWADVIRGFANESNLQMVNATLQKMEARNISGAPSFTFDQSSRALASSDQVDLMNETLDWALFQGAGPSATLANAAISQAVRKGRVAWAEQLLACLPKNGLTTDHLDSVLLVAAAAGNDAEQVDRRLRDLLLTSPELRPAVSTNTFNQLMRLSLEKSQNSNVEKYASFIGKYGLQRDATTYILWMCSRLQSKDVQGATRLYEKLENETTNEDIDIPALNELIRYLCVVYDEKFDHDITLSLVDRLLESKGSVEAPTVAALCKFMLSQQDTAGVADLLEHVGVPFGSSDQDLIRRALVSYVKDPQQSSDRAWEIYELVVKVFPSTTVATRTEIMQAFFAKEQPDYACLVFGHMRAEDTGGLRPTKDIYVECLKGIARFCNEDNLKMVHNMLKMDMLIKFDTRLMNALMLAYASCGDPITAMNHFEEILNSEEGPSEESLLIFFRTCEVHPDGRKEAMDMMKRLAELDVGTDRVMYTAFVAALASHGDLEGATTAIRTMASKIGEQPEAITIATLYNALPAPMLRARIEEWTKTTFPNLWTAVEALEYIEEPGIGRVFKVDRTINV